ncbi:TonB-dependent hemoglobin/transferrin/lactoferrin family receptor [Haemophilus influenzae]|uniref:TonB-dependent hemoglobin/transferrin/lactoferrin family receptor n=1 Tax=Haemophilus influenzae TaxID=727 RepID=UPI000D01881C|nr:TonB-dependent hemoglobin/transferrin/lactoferrin family receptor [Haemophilus influenzae]PRI26305.1 Hemoglobin and hemoglobin-haptoglobin-binding protein A precursor [Haemophilus influenzae]PRI29531.1 Hemoglobin and hemoglobin-haptoglobin-binding protein A precursor [Haemophilus influenzae]PRJ00026.1 Hemoglobin and hemoglobin-haptoglobin-binding protein A precursor [Haemophilus influenzae]PRJ99631.1 Hemoglobin and hemoglobin-haptoglobin-binding protein A precursor [Haemophilus influenzae]P
MGSDNHNDNTPPKIAETIKTAKKLEKEQAQDVKDLVRYETGITVVEAGRFGNSGFAVRGVDENRVAVQIDGLHQAETISSQGFKELFEGYGNFNNTRNTAEIETLKQVTIRKGADSLKSGSGALGGSVSFDTKDARDYLLNKNYYASYKRGYNTADNQNLQTLTLAGRYKYFDAIAVITSRKGHELENYGYKNYNDRIQGREREKADPYRRTQESKLLKFAFQPTENHRLSVVVDLYKQTSKGHDFSYTLKQNTEHMTYDEVELRHTNDKVDRKNLAFTYENFTETPFWDTLKISYSHQKITTTARTDDYCDGNDKCALAGNPLGMKYNQDNQLVGEDGNLAKYKDINTKQTIHEKLPFTKPNEKWRYNRVDWDALKKKYPGVPIYASCIEENNDPSKYCSYDVEIPKKENTFEINGKQYDLLSEADKNVISDEQRLPTNSSYLFSCDGLNCDKDTIQGFEKKGTTVNIPFVVIEKNGKKYAKTEAVANNQLSGPYIFMPSKTGYQTNLWTQRDLTSETKQINLDLTKHLELGKTQHDLSYGGLWSEMEKSMTNISGDSPMNVKWWAQYPHSCDIFLPSSTPNGAPTLNPERTNTLCNNSNVYSFLIPVKTKTGALYFINDFRVNSHIAFNFGYRYDRVKYDPEYIPGKTPKIPDDMVVNLYVKQPTFDDTKVNLPPEELRKKEANAAANIKAIVQPKKFSASSYSVGTTLDPLNWLRLQAKYGKAFRAPTSDEIYFTFLHPDFSIRPNRDLQAETAKTKELALTLHNEIGYVTTSVFDTRYRNFIDLAYKGLYNVQRHSKLTPYHTYQNVNRPNAKVTGWEIAAQISLGKITQFLNGLNLSYKYTYQKGRIDGNIPMNAIQPKTSVYGVSYAHPADKFGLDLYFTHVSAKNAEDTYNMFYKEEGKKDSTIKWRSKSYTTIDLLGYIKPIKNLTLRAGVYNLTNRKYITWDSARSIRPFGTSNMINQKTGEGINRFYAPGRNYRMSVQFEF